MAPNSSCVVVVSSEDVLDLSDRSWVGVINERAQERLSGGQKDIEPSGFMNRAFSKTRIINRKIVWKLITQHRKTLG